MSKLCTQSSDHQIDDKFSKVQELSQCIEQIQRRQSKLSSLKTSQRQNSNPHDVKYQNGVIQEENKKNEKIMGNIFYMSHQRKSRRFTQEASELLKRVAQTQESINKNLENTQKSYSQVQSEIQKHQQQKQLIDDFYGYQLDKDDIISESSSESDRDQAEGDQKQDKKRKQNKYKNQIQNPNKTNNKTPGYQTATLNYISKVSSNRPQMAIPFLMKNAKKDLKQTQKDILSFNQSQQFNNSYQQQPNYNNNKYNNNLQNISYNEYSNNTQENNRYQAEPWKQFYKFDNIYENDFSYLPPLLQKHLIPDQQKVNLLNISEKKHDYFNQTHKRVKTAQENEIPTDVVIQNMIQRLYVEPIQQILKTQQKKQKQRNSSEPPKKIKRNKKKKTTKITNNNDEEEEEQNEKVLSKSQIYLSEKQNNKNLNKSVL